MTDLKEDVRLTVYSPGVESLGGAVDFQRRENILSGASSLGGGRAQPLEARTETMRSKIRLVDDGSITGEMYNSDGEPIILGRLVEVEVRWDGGTWERVAAGRVVGVNQTEAVREYELQIADEGQMLREQSAFASGLSAPFGGGADTASVLPRGLIDPWRDFDGGRTVRYRVDAFEGSSNEAVKIVIGGELDDDTGGSIRKGPAALTDELQDLILDDVREDASAFSKQPALEDGRGDFRTLRFHDVGTDSDQEVFAVGDLTGSFDSDGEYRKPMQNPLILWVYWPGHSLSVGDEGDFYLYMPNHEPTEALPKHFGGSSGVRQWQHLKDGLDATGVRYDTSAVDALIGQGELIWPRETEDLTMMEHLRRTVLWPNGYMLAPNESGELTPVRITIPRSDEVPDVSTLPTLDKSTVSGPDYPTWSHTRDDQVTVLKFKAHSMQGPVNVSYGGPPTKGDTSQISRRTAGSADGLRESTFEIEKTHETATYGRHEMEVHLSGMKDRATFQRVASHLAQMIFDRWGSGTIISELGALKTHDGVGVGEFVIVDLADFPNGAIQDRGGQRLVQVIERVKDLRPGVTLRVLDAGPNSQPLLAPSVSTSQNANRPESVIDATLSGIVANAENYVLEYNKSSTDPPNTDPGWTKAGSFPAVNTTPRIDGLEAGAQYWVRARVTATDRLASDWSTHSSTTTAGFGSVTNISFSNITGSEALASWTLPNDEQPVELTLTNTTQSQQEYSQRLDPGTSEKYLTGLSSGDSYELAVAMVDEAGNAGPASTATFTAGSTNDTLPAPGFIGIQYGRAEHRGERSASAQTGVVVWTVPADPAVPLVFQRAPDDGSGNPDTANTTEFLQQAGVMQFTDTSVSPGDGPYWYRTLHRQQGYDDSSPSEWARAVPVALPGVIGPTPTQPLVDVDLRIDGSGNLSMFVDGEPRIEAIRYDTGTTDFASLNATSGTLATTDAQGDVDVTNIATLSEGQTGYVEVAVYTDAAGDGSPLAYRSSSFTRGSGTGTDTIYPVVDENITESGDIGSLDLDILDEQNRVTAIEFQKKTDASGFSGTWVSTWDRSTGVTGTDDALTRGEDITMDAEHNVAIKYRVQFDDRSGNTHTTSGSAVFDTDESANVNVSAYLDTEGDLIATIRGGPDVDTGQAPSLKLWAGTTSPDTSTTPDYTADNVQEVEGVDTGLDFNNTFVYVVAKGVNSRGEDGPPDKTLALSNPADPVPPFNVTVSENRESASASVSVAITGSESYDIEILQVEPDGTSTSLVSNTGVTDGGAGDPTTANPSLSEKVSTILKVVVKNSTTGEILHEETHTFDPLEKPDFSTFTAEANEQGQIKVTALGDADTASWQIEYDFTGDGTVDETSTGNGTGVLETSSGKIPRETTGDVTVTLYTQTGQSGGTTSDTAEVTFTGGYPQNLLGTDAGSEQSFGDFYLYLDQEPIGDLELEVGDVLSAGLLPRSETGSDNVRVQIAFRDSGGSAIQFSNGNQIASSTYGTRSTVENVTIPANTATISVAADNVENTETAYARRAMLNRGPSAAPFDEPPIRRQREGQVIEAGLLRNQADDDGVVLSGSVPAGWSRWLNLSDAGEPFLKHENIELRQNGDAVFTGTLSAATGSIGTLDIADDLFLGTSHDIRWGTQASPATVTKSMVLGPQGFTPADDGTAWNQNLIYISTNDLNESFYFAPVLVAPGVEITALRARVFANDVSQDTTEVALYRANRTAQTNTLVSSTLSPSADATWETVSDTSISETVADDVYLVRFRGDAASATTACRVAWVELDYDVSNLRQSI